MYVVSIFSQALFFSSKYQPPRQDYAQHLQYPIVLTLVLSGNHIETQVRQSCQFFFLRFNRLDRDYQSSGTLTVA